MLMKGLSPRPSRNRDAHFDYMDNKYEQEQERQRDFTSLADEYNALEDELMGGLEAQLRYLERRERANEHSLDPAELSKTLTSLLELQEGLGQLPGFLAMKRRVGALEMRLRQQQEAVDPAAVVKSVPWRSKSVSQAAAGVCVQTADEEFELEDESERYGSTRPPSPKRRFLEA